MLTNHMYPESPPWSAKETSTVGEVTVAVGLGRSGAVAEQLEDQRDRIAGLDTENEKLRKRLGQIEDVKARLAALEAERNPSVMAGLTGPVAGLLLGLFLGGVLGAVLLWRRRG